MSKQKNDFFKSQPWVPDLLKIILTDKIFDKNLEILIQKTSNNMLQEEKRRNHNIDYERNTINSE